MAFLSDPTIQFNHREYRLYCLVQTPGLGEVWANPPQEIFELCIFYLSCDGKHVASAWKRIYRGPKNGIRNLLGLELLRKVDRQDIVAGYPSLLKGRGPSRGENENGAFFRL